ncbi:hypothetical protein GTR02_05695 [Kineococcus sp. R8]|uniref:hypothetical protein n=1 Tax=Kineococcus siccus TaxID=2696567 RepID=UPI001411F4AB|nr:hypothetical protein [Kineococcus siccus]NAZ81304.1 hypothetical protein [Kineococcus siccus]
MSTPDATPTGTQAPARGAQTVAPVQASALEFAASILGDGGYVPERRLGAALTAGGRGQDALVVPPVVEPVVEPEPRLGFFARLWRRIVGG